MGQIVLTVPGSDAAATIIGIIEAVALAVYPALNALIPGKPLTQADYICLALAALAGIRGYVTNKQPTAPGITSEQALDTIISRLPKEKL